MVADVKRGVVDKKNCSSGGITYQHIFRHPNHTWEGKLIKSLLLRVRKEDQFKARFYPCYKNIIKLLSSCVCISFVRNLVSHLGQVYGGATSLPQSAPNAGPGRPVNTPH